MLFPGFERKDALARAAGPSIPSSTTTRARVYKLIADCLDLGKRGHVTGVLIRNRARLDTAAGAP